MKVSITQIPIYIYIYIDCYAKTLENQLRIDSLELEIIKTVNENTKIESKRILKDEMMSEEKRFIQNGEQLRIDLSPLIQEQGQIIKTDGKLSNLLEGDYLRLSIATILLGRFPEKIHCKLREVLDIEVIRHRIEYTYKSKMQNILSSKKGNFASKCASYQIEKSSSLLDRLSVLKVCRKFIFPVPLIIDTFGAFGVVYKYLLNNQLKIPVHIENFTVVETTENNICNCIQDGKLLLIKDMDFILLKMVSPIIKWFKDLSNQRMRLKYSKKKQKKVNDMQLLFARRMINVHKNFRIFLFTSMRPSELPKALLSDTMFFYFDINHKKLWKNIMLNNIFRGMECKIYMI